MVNRRAKIVCTLGPATGTATRLTELIDAGMDVARLNFSHSTRAEHSALYGMVREIAAERGRVVGVLADLQGPKIRLGCFAAGPVVWATGERIVITTAACPGDHDRVSTTYEGLAADVRPGDRLLVDDGKIDLRVLDVDRRRHQLRGPGRWSGQRPQGHIASGGCRQRSALVREGHRGSEVRPRARCRHGGHVLRPSSRGGRSSHTPSWTRSAGGCPSSRNSRSRRRFRTCRRSSRRSTD